MSPYQHGITFVFHKPWSSLIIKHNCDNWSVQFKTDNEGDFYWKTNQWGWRVTGQYL
jgi:hypothetical protein